MPPKATPALSVGSMSDDEMSGAKAADSSSEAPESRQRKPVLTPEATSPVEEKPWSRPPPPVPETPASPTSYQRSPHHVPKRRSSTFTPTIQTVVSDDESAAYEGDYDTDMAPAVNQRDAPHDSRDEYEENVSSPTTPYDYRPPPVPSSPPPRAAPPPPIPSVAPPPPRHTTAPPPPPPTQPP
ncbi:hypothetical protein KEM54_004779, partial [Ascosphaera aggregata]